MNGYAVSWQSEAEDELASIWIQALDRQAVTQAQVQVDRLLARDPLGCGSEVAEGLWKIMLVPLVVYYEVDNNRRRVTVVKVL
jgi:hypothetical protein